MEIIDKENQLALLLNLVVKQLSTWQAPLAKRGVKILGTSVDSIDMAEDRERFDELLAKLGIPSPSRCFCNF